MKFRHHDLREIKTDKQASIYATMRSNSNTGKMWLSFLWVGGQFQYM